MFSETLLMPYQAVSHPGAGSALILAPHPDDEVFGCAGAILRHVDSSESVQVVIVTDGHAPSSKASVAEQETYISERQEESRQAARMLNYGTPIFWGLPDRGIEYGERLIARILEAIQAGHFDRVYAPSILETHPDHRALGMAAAEAVRRSDYARHLVLYEVSAPLRPNVLLDITDLIEIKQAAMACFESQLALQEYDQQITALNRYRAYTLPKQVKYAEAYWQIDAENLRANPIGLYDSEHRRQHQLGLLTDAGTLPLVSIIVRSTGRRTLTEALDSIALQTWPNVEVIVVDALGKGHPPVGEWCGRFPMRLVSTGQPLGRSQAANLGLENIRGRYINFLDDDDLFDPDHVAGLMEVFEDQQYEIAYSGVQCIDENRDNINRVFNQPYEGVNILVGNHIPNNALLFSSEFLKNDCRFDESLEYYEDWDFILQLTRIGNIHHLDKITARYRVTENSGIGVHGVEMIDQTNHFRKLFSKWRHNWTDSEVEQVASKARNYEDRVRDLNELRKVSAMERTKLKNIIREKENILRERDNRISEMIGSRSWRITAPLRNLVNLLQKIKTKLST